MTDKSLQVNTSDILLPCRSATTLVIKILGHPPSPQHSMLVRTRSSHLQTFVREQPPKTGALFHATLNFGGAGWRQLMLALPIVRSLFTCKLLSVTCRSAASDLPPEGLKKERWVYSIASRTPPARDYSCNGAKMQWCNSAMACMVIITSSKR